MKLVDECEWFKMMVRVFLYLSGEYQCRGIIVSLFSGYSMHNEVGGYPGRVATHLDGFFGGYEVFEEQLPGLDYFEGLICQEDDRYFIVSLAEARGLILSVFKYLSEFHGDRFPCLKFGARSALCYLLEHFDYFHGKGDSFEGLNAILDRRIRLERIDHGKFYITCLCDGVWYKMLLPVRRIDLLDDYDKLADVVVKHGAEDHFSVAFYRKYISH
ncbi:hypothetical protein ACQUQU_05935 [Thalassolituus sp. LLYu03]|uniref:hypothetical protein n=1 Tax=Thalassolituus sp. LLYu03 TaxID=3421656 RepID=UPI003D280C9E